jgi:hypothetical protein
MITSVNAFPFGLPYKRHRRPLDSINVIDPPCRKRLAKSATKIAIIFELTKKNDRKV